jgi:hypothetical protein
MNLTSRLQTLIARMRASHNAFKRAELRAERAAMHAHSKVQVQAAELIALEIRGARSQQGKLAAKDARRLEQSRTARLALLQRSAPTMWE